MPHRRRRLVVVARRPVEFLEARVLLSTYYVAPGGADTAPGTLGAPPRTVQRAANLAQPGDTVLIRGGTYRETVRPARSGTSAARITFKAYNGERVVISGADFVTGWSTHSGSIYKTPQAWDLGTGKNQVFVDGRMMIEARWPNTSLDVSRPTKAVADSISATVNGASSTARLRDAALTHAAHAWDGATIHIMSGQGWVGQTGRVTHPATGVLDFTYEQRTYPGAERFETPSAGDPYYLTGKFVGLDAPGEWFRDAGTGLLYLRTPASDSPAGHRVEAKRRNFAFELAGRSFIDVDDIDLFAATVRTDAASDSIRLSRIDAQYVSHYTLMSSGWRRPDDTGIMLLGTDGVLRDSTVAFSSAHGVALGGRNNRVENTIVHDVAYNAGNEDGITVRGNGNVVVRNTFYNTGRSGIRISDSAATKVLNNVVHHAGLQTTDFGALYTENTDGSGSEIAYNVLHDIKDGIGGGFGGVGLYLDNESRNYLVHHNVVYRATHALKMNPVSRNNRVYNNTLDADGGGASLSSSGSRDMTGSVFYNNVFTDGASIGAGATQSNNILGGVDVRFVDWQAGNYQLRSDSPAINRGRVISPYTDGYVGTAPDLGAYEFGKAAFTAGARDAASSAPPTPSPTPTPTPTRNARGTIQAESYDTMFGVRKDSYGIGYLNSGDWVKYARVDFGAAGVTSFRARVAVDNAYAGKTIEVRVGGASGTLLGRLKTAGTGGWNTYAVQTAVISRVAGLQDLYLVFQGGDGVANVDWFTFG